MTLVRHGQAGQMGEEYDQLSPLGVQQATSLGEYWVQRDEEFDEVYVGTMVRQQKSEAAVRAVYEAAGRPWPKAEVLPGLDEYDSNSILGQLVPELAERDEVIAGFRKRVGDGPNFNHIDDFQRMFEAVVRYWVRGDHGEPKFETWAEFSGRVRDALKNIMKREGSGRRVAVFSSGGPIGVSVQTAMRAPELAAAELNWRVRNGSTTHFVFSPGRLTLESFNTLAHITEESLVTFR